MNTVAGQPGGDPASHSKISSLLVIVRNEAMLRRISMALGTHGLSATVLHETPEAASGEKLDDSAIVVFACGVDDPRQLASLRRLRRDLRRPALVLISPPITGTGVRRALDAGADALVFDTELENTLPTAVHAVAMGQSVVPRKLRAGVERPVLSHRERQVVALVRNGLSNAEIAERLYLAESTIKSHLSSIFAKFGVRSRKEAAAVFVDLEAMTNGVSVGSDSGPPLSG